MSILGEDARRVSFLKINIEGAERSPREGILRNKDTYLNSMIVVSKIYEPRRCSIIDFTNARFEFKLFQNEYVWLSYRNTDRIDGNLYGLCQRMTKAEDYVFLCVSHRYD